MTPPRPSTLRRCADGLYCLVATPVFCVVMFGFFCPLVLVSPTLPLRRAIGRAAVHVCLALIGQRLRREAMNGLPDTPAVVVSNHASYMDGLILTAVLPGRFTFVVQDGAARWPFVGRVLRRMGDPAVALIEQSPDGILLLGRIGERVVEHYGFYAVFQTAEEYRIVSNGKTLGTLPVLTVLAPDKASKTCQ